MKRTWRHLAARDFSHVIFGDIDLEEHKAWADRVCHECGLEAVEPLWGLPTVALFTESIGRGGHAVIAATRAALLDATWLNRRLDRSMRPLLQAPGLDPCGERVNIRISYAGSYIPQVARQDLRIF